MKTTLFFIGYGLLFVALQSVFSLPVDFLLYAVIALGLNATFGQGAGLALLLGAMLDVASLQPFGGHMISYGGLFLLIWFLRSRLAFPSLWRRFLLIGLFSLAEGMILWGWTALTSELARPFVYFISLLWGKMLMDAACGALWLPVLHWVQQWNLKTTFYRNSPRA